MSARVMVVDDEEGIAELVATALQASGFEPVIAHDGEEAWTKLRTEGADLIVLDVNMPRLTGLELLQRLRGDKRFKRIPVLLLTVRSSVDEQEEGYDTGADDYLAKPFEPSILVARVQALDRRTRKLIT